MNVLVVNIGSTSFKFRLFDMTTETVLARGGVDGVGKEDSRVYLQQGDEPMSESVRPIADQAEAVKACIGSLTTFSFEAVGFKAVLGGSIADPVRVDDHVLGVMESFFEAAPAHNPPYVAAMKAFQVEKPDLPLVAAFETGFHQSIPLSRQTFAIPSEWTEEHGIRRYGFHGASHRYISWRVAELEKRTDLKIISCHLGGSSSICAIDSGKSVGNSFAMTAQSGVPHNNRVGDFDPYALLPLMAKTGKDAKTLLSEMAKQGGLLGISGVSNDMPKLLEAAAIGNEKAELAIECFVEGIRHYIGSYYVAMGGMDVLVFTGGIGERSAEIRRRVCRGFDCIGAVLDVAMNETDKIEKPISCEYSRAKIMVVPTNEEIVVARQTVGVLKK